MKKEHSRVLSANEVSMGLMLIDLILDDLCIKNITDFYDKREECNWSKISKMVLSKCYFDIDGTGNIKKFHKVDPQEIFIKDIDECEYVHGRYGKNIFIIVHL